MNFSILKSLSIPGLIDDADITRLVQERPKLSRLISDLCIGADGLSNPSLRIGGINVPNENESGCVVLSTSDGCPTLFVNQNVDHFYVEALNTHLVERGGNRNVVESERAPYIVKRVRNKMKHLQFVGTTVSDRHRSIFNSAMSQIAEKVRSGAERSSKIEVESNILFNILEAYRKGLPVDTGNVDELCNRAYAVMNSRSAAEKCVQEKLLDRKYWLLANHGHYGMAVYSGEFIRGLSAADIVSGRRSSSGLCSDMVLNLHGWYKSLQHMSQLNPDLHREVYTQMVFTKQMYEADKGTSASAYQARPRYLQVRSVFNANVERVDYPDFDLLMPRGDFYHDASALSSWTYSATNAKTSSACIMERVV